MVLRKLPTEGSSIRHHDAMHERVLHSVPGNAQKLSCLGERRQRSRGVLTIAGPEVGILGFRIAGSAFSCSSRQDTKPCFL